MNRSSQGLDQSAITCTLLPHSSSFLDWLFAASRKTCRVSGLECEGSLPETTQNSTILLIQGPQLEQGFGNSIGDFFRLLHCTLQPWFRLQGQPSAFKVDLDPKKYAE